MLLACLHVFGFVKYSTKCGQDESLQGWRRVIEKNRFGNWAELRMAFSAIDKVGELTVFDIGGNKYRLIAYIRFEKQIIYIKAVLTHREYDKGRWKS